MVSGIFRSKGVLGPLGSMAEAASHGFGSEAAPHVAKRNRRLIAHITSPLRVSVLGFRGLGFRV